MTDPLEQQREVSERDRDEPDPVDNLADAIFALWDDGRRWGVNPGQAQIIADAILSGEIEVPE